MPERTTQSWVPGLKTGRAKSLASTSLRVSQPLWSVSAHRCPNSSREYSGTDASSEGPRTGSALSLWNQAPSDCAAPSPDWPPRSNKSHPTPGANAHTSRPTTTANAAQSPARARLRLRRLAISSSSRRAPG